MGAVISSLFDSPDESRSSGMLTPDEQTIACGGRRQAVRVGPEHGSPMGMPAPLHPGDLSPTIDPSYDSSEVTHSRPDSLDNSSEHRPTSYELSSTYRDFLAHMALSGNLGLHPPQLQIMQSELDRLTNNPHQPIPDREIRLGRNLIALAFQLYYRQGLVPAAVAIEWDLFKRLVRGGQKLRDYHHMADRTKGLIDRLRALVEVTQTIVESRPHLEPDSSEGARIERLRDMLRNMLEDFGRVQSYARVIRVRLSSCRMREPGRLAALAALEYRVRRCRMEQQQTRPYPIVVPWWVSGRWVASEYLLPWNGNLGRDSVGLTVIYTAYRARL